MRYCVLFPEAKNVHLIKDVGMIAYKMHKLYGYEAYIACYDDDNYDYLKDEVKGLKIDFIEKNNNTIIDGLRYLRKKSNEIDVLQIFHITLRSVFYAFAYKRYNSKGKIFLKLDCTEKLVKIIGSMGYLKFGLFNAFLNKVDIIGVEQKGLFIKLKSLLKKQQTKIMLVPNGIDFDSSIYSEIDYSHKKNIILTVGRIGSIEKRHDILLEGFSKIREKERKNWQVIFIGPVEENFKMYSSNFFKNHPEIEESITFTGAIYDRRLLAGYYKKAKIFCLTSEFESFGIALLEAASFGDVIVSSDVGIAKEITTVSGGKIVNANNSEALALVLEDMINNPELEIISNKTINVCRENYNWDYIVSILQEKIGKKEVNIDE